MSNRKEGDRKECRKCSEPIDDDAGFSNFTFIGSSFFRVGECQMSLCDNLNGERSKFPGEALCPKVRNALQSAEPAIVGNTEDFNLYTDDYVDPKDKKPNTRPVVVEKKNAFYKC